MGKEKQMVEEKTLGRCCLSRDLNEAIVWAQGKVVQASGPSCARVLW